MRRPLVHALVAVAPLPLVQLLAAGHLALVLPVLTPAAAGAAAVQLRGHHEHQLRRTARQAAERYAAQVLLEVYET